MLRGIVGLVCKPIWTTHHLWRCIIADYCIFILCVLATLKIISLIPSQYEIITIYYYLPALLSSKEHSSDHNIFNYRGSCKQQLQDNHTKVIVKAIEITQQLLRQMVMVSWPTCLTNNRLYKKMGLSHPR